MIYIFLFPLFFVVMLLYFRLAIYYNITDKPNERSSHQNITTRGGGVVYLFAAAIALALYPGYWVLVLALFIAGGISFADDWLTLSGRIRIFFHVIAVTVLFYYLNVFNILAWWQTGLLYILVIGIINAYNFMDGINGITGLYSLLILAGLQYVNIEYIGFINPDIIWLPIMASTVFLFFNFRKNAVCFAGDVGSVTLACWILFLLLSLILKTGNWSYLLFLAVYGVDSVLTIVHRLILKQNIFAAHRMHLYQLLANEQKIPHLFVAVIYSFIQFLITVYIISYPDNFYTNFSLSVLPLTIIYVVSKFLLMKKS